MKNTYKGFTMRIKAIILALLGIGSFQLQAGAQQVEKNFELGEIIRIAGAYQEVSYLSFQTQMIIADSAYKCCDGTSTPQADTLFGQYKLHDTRYWSMLDSVEYVQGYMYNLALYHADKLISVAKPSFENRVMMLSILDSTFQQAHVNAMSITQVDSVTRSFTITFNAQSRYSGYDLRYDKNTYMLKSIVYYLKNGYERDNGTTATAKITVNFMNYDTSEISNDYFLEDKYIYKDASGFKTKPSYNGYQIITTDDL